jgi:hypothetical protein
MFANYNNLTTKKEFFYITRFSNELKGRKYFFLAFSKRPTLGILEELYLLITYLIIICAQRFSFWMYHLLRLSEKARKNIFWLLVSHEKNEMEFFHRSYFSSSFLN